ncbi:uncharacterized protein FOMMEDRAFT_86227 [Fomitiporia mediterranea MF3/22]|uniref:uncharacterized protein n=1 Tax=Fomitiporia mediterranea (strain MF3/22) TaxID=694068 RepID=UPI00044086FE|nr:uncharacterized protein FOMMEDRAFT_86227 [Fomitiporia mediterranea MF3/22]EJD03293.1 hypothetical protein FOMMEDRAFT_86227 [Fomitiporia mediterranea MF3/22]
MFINLKQALLRFKFRFKIFFRLDGSRRHHKLADDHWRRFEQSGEREDLETSINHCCTALKLRSEGHPGRLQSLFCLALSLYTRYERWGQTGDLDEAIKLYRAALELRHEGHPLHCATLNNLANSMRARFLQHRRIEDIEEAFVFDRAALELRPKGHPLRSMSLDNLAVSLRIRFLEYGSPEDLEEAIQLNRAALEFRPEGHTDRSVSLANLAAAIHIRFSLNGRSEDLEEVVNLERAVLELHPEGHPFRSISLNRFAVSLRTRFSQCGRIEDINDAIELHQTALKLLPDVHPDRPMSMSDLACCLRIQFCQYGWTEDVEEAVKLHRAALELRPYGHRLHCVSLNELAISLRLRYSQDGRIEDLKEAIELHRASLMLHPDVHPDPIRLLRSALELRPEGHHLRYVSVNELAVSLRMHFLQDGRIEDLKEAIELHKATLKLLPNTHPNRSITLSNLACCLRIQFSQYGRTEDIEEAIRLLRRALELRPEGHRLRYVSLNELAVSLRIRFLHDGRLLPEGHPDRFISLSTLANSLHTRFGQQGKAEDLEEAVDCHRATLLLLPEGHPFRATSLNRLATALHTRFEQHGSTEDLDETIKLERTALELRPEVHPDRSMSLGNLAISLHTRFGHQGKIRDLEETVELHRAALALVPDGYLDRSSILRNLGNSLCHLFEQHERTEVLDEAIKRHQAALELCPEGHPDHSISLYNLAVSLSVRFEQHRRTEDLEAAIKLHRSSQELHSIGHPLRSKALRNLVTCLYARIRQQWHAEEFEECMQLLELAATHTFSGVLECLLAARKWANLARLHNHTTTFTAYKATLSLLQYALNISPTLHAQHDFLLSRSNYRILILEAASYSADTNKLEQAIEILEQGRGLLWSQLRGFRAPLDQLAETNKELVDRFRGVNGSLALNMGTEPKLFDELLKLKKRLSSKQEEIIREIRQFPGFENFLEATPFKQLQQVALEGPVIMVNHCRYRSDALIILTQGASSVDCVPLDGEFYWDSIKLCDALLETRRRVGADSPEYDRKLQEAMKMLWDRVVSKVVVKLKEHKIAEGSRIWWCPTSILSMLPFHAAGPFEDADGAPKYLLDDYISSYIPTLGALINARSGASEDESTVLIVGDTSLRSARQEIRNIRNCGKSTKLLASKKASRGAVVDALREEKWVHFVCHGNLRQEPLYSSFKLSDGELTLLDIVQTNLPNAEFAFLSACHTAEQPHDGAHDEVLHLAAAMQFSGFRSVIGSMWELLDEDGPAFAKTVYEYMNECEPGEAKYKRAAAGLRKAALELKAKDGISTERWVNLVHIGA